MWSEHRLISFDETPLFYRRLKTKETPKAVILIVHGMGEHGGRYRVFAEYLAELGVESWVPDLRGFGQSGGKRACLKRFLDFWWELLWMPHYLCGKAVIISAHSLAKSPLKQKTNA